MNPGYVDASRFISKSRTLIHILSITQTKSQFDMSINNQPIRLTLLDEDSLKPIPARVEVVDTAGKSYIAEDALPTGGD